MFTSSLRGEVAVPVFGLWRSLRPTAPSSGPRSSLSCRPVCRTIFGPGHGKHISNRRSLGGAAWGPDAAASGRRS